MRKPIQSLKFSCPQCPRIRRRRLTCRPSSILSFIVRAHPHHTGYDTAFIAYEDNAHLATKDTSWLYVCGLAPGIFTTNTNYGTMLYGTTKDSFVLATNTGQIPCSMNTVQNAGPDNSLFVGHQYFAPIRAGRINIPCSRMTFKLAIRHGIPIGCHLADKLGAANDTIIFNTSAGPSPSDLKAFVIQPHIWGVGDTSADSSFLGGTDTQTVQFGNFAGATGDVLIIDSVHVGGTDGSAWKVDSMYTISGDRIPLPNAAAPDSMQPGDAWTYMTFNRRCTLENIRDNTANWRDRRQRHCCTAGKRIQSLTPL